MKSLIKKLKMFAEQNFPVAEVSSYLTDLDIPREKLEKYCHFNDGFYTRNLVHKERDFEILVICWPAGQAAPIHGHEGEKCWARVQSGTLKICNYEQKSNNPLLIKRVEKVLGGPNYLDGPADIHSVENPSNEFAISLHIYAKPFDSCDIYNLEYNRVERIKLQYYSKFGHLC
jgi:cysteine dioxygenase